MAGGRAQGTGYTEPLEPVFAKGQMVFGAAMLVGTLGGGLLGQISLSIPYLVRAATFLPLFLLAYVGMSEIGFTPRALEWRRVPAEMRRVFVEGMKYGLHHRVVRPVMFASLVNMSFMIFGFYSWQRYFLDLLGRDLVWVSGLIAALLSLSMILGNALVKPLSRMIKTRTGLLAASSAAQALTVVLCGALGEAVTGGAAHAHGVPARFFVVVGLYLVYGIALGTMGPVKQGYLNAHIPSEQRATIISLDALFADAGGVAGQSGWGYLAKVRSIGEAWIYAGVTLLLDVPMYFIARKNDKTLDKF